MGTARPLDDRLAAICDASVFAARESAGRHEYDGTIQDLSPAGVDRALAALGGPPGTPSYPDPHDEALASAAERALRVRLGELELHRSNPVWHIDNLDLSGYDREYAPAPERAAARRAHLARWPEGVDAAIEALDRVPAPLAAATLPLARGLASFVGPDSSPVHDAARHAVGRFVRHLERAVVDGPPLGALGSRNLARLLGSAEALDIDLDLMTTRVDAERDRLRRLRDQACRRLDPRAEIADTIRSLQEDHPDTDGVITEFRALVEEAVKWVAEHDLAPDHDVLVEVLPMPEAQRRALAGATWAAANEADAPGRFHVSLPLDAWSATERDQWLRTGFSRNLMANMVVHEVAPGHLSHGRAMRRATSEVRRTVLSEVFIEGWAHYCEEMALEEGFRIDPAFAVAVAQDALRRVTRFACAIGLHTGEMTINDAARRFTEDVALAGPAALHEAQRGLFDPTYGRYTWGKFAVVDLREQARRQWGPAFSLPRFHAALLNLGAPPLGLLGIALERG
ncbi:DUF885 family protein [Embleya sp. NBC_00896]|uniref:DUF885 family protein n=1 Tax=Embleya sp. NBC_00896 TaxID=2975961 RepID=UPI002F9138BE|nr:DUF885 domain-containing protein [Embleya sp. NBC_00896]